MSKSKASANKSILEWAKTVDSGEKVPSRVAIHLVIIYVNIVGWKTGGGGQKPISYTHDVENEVLHFTPGALCHSSYSNLLLSFFLITSIV